MTLVEAARAGRLTPDISRVARSEGIAPETLARMVAEGKAVIPKNRLRKLIAPCGIGKGLRTKINANIGTSKDSSSVSEEIVKMVQAIRLGADAIMDLSTGPDIKRTRRSILARCNVPFGTVPIYEIALRGIESRGSVKDITPDEMFDVLESQAAEGVDFFTIHAGVVQRCVEALRVAPRILPIVSRGGAFLAEWMIENSRENPFYERFDRVIDIAKRYDVTISLGDGMRPGSVADASDAAQIQELIALGRLQREALSRGVQVMIEGPGHVPLDQIEANVKIVKSLCNDAPLYVLGPLVTDIAPGYDHISAAIGGALAAYNGADFLCYVTPAEHLRLPTIDDVMEGVIASKIAAHAADIAKGIRGSIGKDVAISEARRKRDWPRQFALAIDRSKPKRYRKQSQPGDKDVCTMCGEYCSIKTSDKCFARKDEAL
jgi:phosphomethylpyrimidine synthase